MTTDQPSQPTVMLTTLTPTGSATVEALCPTCGDTADTQPAGLVKPWAEWHARTRQHAVTLTTTTTTTVQAQA
jgi:cytochrome c5